MAIKDKYKIKSISNHIALEWLLKKHYAKRTPIMMYVFGLYNEENIIVGVCVFSPAPSRFWNDGGKLFNDKHKITTM